VNALLKRRYRDCGCCSRYQIFQTDKGDCFTRADEEAAAEDERIRNIPLLPGWEELKSFKGDVSWFHRATSKTVYVRPGVPEGRRYSEFLDESIPVESLAR
jgi:hypothetical protein